MNNAGSSKKKSFYFWMIISCLFVGMLVFFIQREWLIFRFNFGFGTSQANLFSARQDISLRRKVKMYYWKDDKFLFDEQVFVWLSDKSENLKHLVNNWFSFLHQERLIDKKISLSNVLVDQGGQQAFFSFEQYPFDHEWSIFQKCSLVECLFKTIKSSGIDIKSVVFLVENQAMEDDHLDFSKEWPIDGFLQEYQNI